MASWKSKEIKNLLRKIHYFCIPTSSGREKYIRKHNIFDYVGENFFFQPRKLPADPKFIRFHNNVVVAADVTFVNHDVIYLLLRNLDPENNQEHMGCIEVMDNVFIGLGSIILPGVRIGENTIVSAGSVVTKDIPPNSIVGGCPAKVIGSFEDLKQRRLAESQMLRGKNLGARNAARAAYEWEKFEQKRQG